MRAIIYGFIGMVLAVIFLGGDSLPFSIEARVGVLLTTVVCTCTGIIITSISKLEDKIEGNKVSNDEEEK